MSPTPQHPSPPLILTFDLYPKHSIKQPYNTVCPTQSSSSPPLSSHSALHLVEQLVALLEAVQQFLVSTEGDDPGVLVSAVHHLPPHALHRLVPLALHRELAVDVLRAENGLQVEPGALARHPAQRRQGIRGPLDLFTPGTCSHLTLIYKQLLSLLLR